MQSPMLERFLAQRQLTQPDGRELFRYRTSDHEFSEIERLLQLSLENIHPAKCVGHTVFAQWFVLWASEWWRREYDGTNLSWTSLLSRLKCADNIWTQEQRAQCITLGMASWCRDAPNTLYQVALEGGLPLRLLTLDKDGRVMALLTLVVHKVAGKQCGILEIRSQVEQMQDMLPQAYRQGCLFMALAEIVTVVLQLGKDAGESDKASDKVVFRLDQKIPAWRERLPFPLDDARTKTFLPQLVEAAAVRHTTSVPIGPSVPETPSQSVTMQAPSPRPTTTPDLFSIPDQAPPPRPAQIAAPPPAPNSTATESVVPQGSAVEQFLARRQIPQPDGRALFLYRTTDEEYEAIRKKLQDMLAAQSGSACASDKDFAQWFTLWASEWWRREYDGSHISWTPILDSLGWPTDVWTPQGRSACVVAGLQRWKRPFTLYGKPRGYIMSVALEGGLPLRLLAEGRGGLGRLLTRVLSRADSARAGKQEVRGWVESLKDMLPQSYRQPVIFMLLTDIIETVIRLKREAGITGGDNAIAALDQRDPKWREQFPLPLEDAHAQGLLSRLFEESAETVRNAPSDSPFVLERSLEEDERGRRLSATLPLPETLDQDKLAAFFAVSVDVLPRQAELTLRAGEKERSVLARRMAGRDQYRMMEQFPDTLDVAAVREHTLELAVDDGRTLSAPVSQGMELDEDLPWYFSAESGHRFLGQGNVKAKETEALLVAPDSWEPPEMEDGGECAPAGELPFCARKIWRLRGAVRVTDPTGESFRFRAGRDDAERMEFVWRGERLWYGFLSPARAFRGLPKLYVVTSGGERRVSGEPVFLALGTKTAVQEGPVFGIYAAGESSCRAKMVLLPQDAGVTLEGRDALSGEIRLRHWGVIRATTRAEGVLLDFEKHADSAVLRFSMADGAHAPEQVELELFWPHTTTPARLKLPYPARGARVFGRDGAEWRDKARIAPGHLLGARILVHTDNVNTRVGLKLQSSGQFSRSLAVGGDKESLQVIIRLQHYEEEIRRMLSMSNALDHTVTLAVLLDGNEIFHLSVLRYEGFLNPTEDKTEVSLDATTLQSLAPQQWEQIRLLACNMLRESDRVIELDQLHADDEATGIWLFPWEERLPGPWLLFPAPDSPVDVRPMRITVAGETRPDSWLAEVMDNRDEEARMNSLASAVERLAADYSHEGWEEVEQWAERIGHLPLTAFDLWRAFAGSPQAMTALAFRPHSRMQRDFVRRFPLELPFVWPVIGFADWKRAMARLRDQCGQIGCEEVRATVFRTQMDSVISRLTDEYPELQFMLGIASSCFLTDKQQEAQRLRLVAPQFADDLFSGENCGVQRLFHRHADETERWPDADAPRDRLREALDTNPGTRMQIRTTDPLRDSLRDALNNTTLAPYFCPTNFPVQRLKTVNAPILLALHCVTGESDRWLREPTLFRLLRECRAFDPEWFETAYNYTVARCLADGLLDVNEQGAT